MHDAPCQKLCRNQYVWVVNIAASMGFYVTLDFHSDKNGDQLFYDSTGFKSHWARLLRCASASVQPVNNGCNCHMSSRDNHLCDPPMMHTMISCAVVLCWLLCCLDAGKMHIHLPR